MIKLHFAPGYDKSLAPVPAARYRDWWEDNSRTKNHAKHCLPLVMANSLGYYILSPGTFMVKWDGDTTSEAQIKHLDRSSHYEVDAHAAYGSFVVQAKFIPVTEKPGDFIFIKGIPNERDIPFTCMEACIEAWWSVGNFGLVYLLHKPGEFIIKRGQPIAQMFMYRAESAAEEIQGVDGHPPGHDAWLKKRSRPDYRKDLDYLNGRQPDLTPVQTHITSWKQVGKITDGSK